MFVEDKNIFAIETKCKVNTAKGTIGAFVF